MSEAEIQPSIPQTISTVYELSVDIRATRQDIAFLVGIYVFSKINEEGAIYHDHLFSLFQSVLDASGDDHENINHLLGNSIARLRENGFLNELKFEYGSGETVYSLEKLGEALAQSRLESERLTRQSLVVITGQIRNVLVQARRHSETKSDDEWHKHVDAPLREIVTMLIGMIAKRQLGMKRSMEEIRSRIHREMTNPNVSGAIQAATEMVETTSNALHELHELVIEEMDSINYSLADIATAAWEGSNRDISDLATKMSGQVNATKVWAAEFHREWSEYYRYVHSYITTVLRIDVNRQLSERLRQAIVQFGDNPWYLRTTPHIKFQPLKEEDLPLPVKRPSIAGFTQDVDIEDADYERVVNVAIARMKFLLETQGQADLVAILREFSNQEDPHWYYLTAGQLVEEMLNVGRFGTLSEDEWSGVGHNLEVENLIVYRKDVP